MSPTFRLLFIASENVQIVVVAMLKNNVFWLFFFFSLSNSAIVFFVAVVFPWKQTRGITFGATYTGLKERLRQIKWSMEMGSSAWALYQP